MKRLPTDLEILNAVYDRYYQTFAEYSEGDESREAKTYVPIDIRQIAGDLRIDGDIVFGRLYYHLEKKHGCRKDDGTSVHFFVLQMGTATHCINFPLAASVLADLRDQSRKHRRATGIAVVSLIISIVAILISAFAD